MASGPVRAVAPQIKDEAKFFSPEAVKKANEDIRDMMRKFGRDLLVETVPTVPADLVVKVKEMSNEERWKYFYNWARERAEASVVNGVYILVCRQPSHLQVFISPKAREIFDAGTRDRLRDALLAEFREKRFDQGLQAAIKVVQDRLAQAARK
jgi:hypothetical protein